MLEGQGIEDDPVERSSTGLTRQGNSCSSGILWRRLRNENIYPRRV